MPFGYYPFWGFLLLPVWLALSIGLAVGLGLYCSALMVRYRDLQYVIPVLVQMVLYISPIAYPVSAVPARYHWAFALNPLTSLLEAFRWSLFHKGDISAGGLAYSTACVAIALVFGAFAFKKMERQFADVI
jgi:lipopolysaccharide transport system permease protein